MRKLDLGVAANQELAILAHFGDEEGSSHLWGRLEALAMRISMSFAKRYKWIDARDLSQSVLLTYPKIIGRYDPSKVKFDTYVAISFYRAAQDELRKQDPLGVRIPQKSQYPAFTHFSSVDGSLNSDEHFDLDGLINDGLKRIDKGYLCSRE